MRVSRLLRWSILLVATLSLIRTSAGQDAGLYDDVIDPDRAYVRVFASESGEISLGGVPVSLAGAEVSGYLSLPPGELAIAPGDEVPVSVEAGSFYTIIHGGESFSLHRDPPVSDPSKALILLYNLAAEAIDLYVPAAQTNAMSAVSAGTSQSAELRAPLTLTFEARSGENLLASAQDVELERRQAVSLFFVQTAQGMELLHALSSFASD